MIWARRFADGLSSLRDRATARLAALRFNPSRKDRARMASLPPIILVKEWVEFSVERRGDDPRATADLAFRWGYMHGQWDARRELVP